MWGQKHLIHNYLHRWGTITSGAVLDPVYRIFTTPNVTGLIGYRIENHCAIVFGDPICEAKNIPAIVEAFHHFCDKNNLKVIYLIVSESFANWAYPNYCHGLIEFGEELYLNPIDEDPMRRCHGGLVRNKVKQANHEGIIIHEYLNEDSNFEAVIQKIETEWIQARKGPQVYVSHGTLFENRMYKRWFYAKQGSEIVGFLVLDRIESFNGWLISNLVSAPKAPRGTSECLVMSVIKTLAYERNKYLSFGVVPLTNLRKIHGLNNFSIAIAKFAFKIANKIFHLERKKMFWQKFLPESHPTFLLFRDTKIGINHLLALKRSLNIGF